MRLYKSYIVFLAIICCASCQEKRSPEFILRASLLVNDSHFWYQSFDFFAQRLEEQSKGRIQLEIYHSEQLAKEVEAIRLIQSGVIDMTSTSSMLNNWIEIAAFCEMPFLIEDTEEMTRLIKSPIGKRIENEIRERTGLRVIGYLPAGARHLTSNRPIKHPDDLNGLLLRVPSIPSFVTAWQACGAKPTPMAFSEVFTGLQQGTVEAQENPLALISSQGFSEVQDYVNLTSHVVSWTYPVIGEKQYQSLPDDLKIIFNDCAEQMQAYGLEIYEKEQLHIKQRLIDQGMEFVEVDKLAFADRARASLRNSLSPEMQEIYRDIVEMKKSWK